MTAVLLAPRVHLCISRHLFRTLIKHPSRISRAFATHRDTPSSLLAQQLDRAARNERVGGTGSGGTDSVGPFQIGGQSLAFKDRGAPIKPWKELSPAGKAARATARATNFTVILMGAGLSAILAYALATELFAKNSPTVLYGDACDRIKASSAVSHFCLHVHHIGLYICNSFRHICHPRSHSIPRPRRLTLLAIAIDTPNPILL